MLRRGWRRLRPVLDRNTVFVPLIIVFVLVLVAVFSRLLTPNFLFFPRTQPRVTPNVAPRTPAPLEGPAPNVVVIVANGQRADTLDEMPNVRRLLGERGFTFTNAFATTPLGSPARATILTGQDSFKSGVHGDLPPGGIYSFKQRSHIGTWLHDSGFTTSYIGRYFGGLGTVDTKGYVPPGWDDWHAFLDGKPSGYYRYTLDENRTIQTIGPSSDSYITDVLADRAVSFIEDAHRPYFLHFASVALQAPATPAEQDLSTFADAPPFRPRSYNVRASGDSPAAEIPGLPGYVVGYTDEYHRNALGALQSLDRAVARIVQAVEARGELDETVFIYTSDKGVLLGEHRIVNAMWPYEPSIKIPLVVRVPWNAEKVTDTRLVANSDITPTIAELTGVKTRLAQDGLSLAPILHREDVRWRQEVRLSFLGPKERLYSPPRYRAIRTDRYKLVVYEDRSRELFDLENDPDEMNNLAGTEAASEIEEPLFRRLDKLMPSLPVIPQPRATFSPRPSATPSID